MYVVYILRCDRGQYYVGHTRGVGRRFERHAGGRGALFTRANRPVQVLYTEAYADPMMAVRRERQIKGWSRRKKEALVAGDFGLLKSLSRSGTRPA